jgi:hypothetical protein
MEMSTTREATSCAALENFPAFYGNRRLNYRIPKSSPPVPILDQSNPVHTPHPISATSILILSAHLRLGHPSGLFPSDFPTNKL